jgi:uncharacterized damage-inducible protein DinB
MALPARGVKEGLSGATIATLTQEHRMRTSLMLAALALAGSNASAQTAGDVYARGAQEQYRDIQALIMRAAEKTGEDLYSFKPTPDVRSFAGVLGHVADGNLLLCRIASGESGWIEKVMKDIGSVQVHEKKTAKADLVAALTESRAFCDSVFAKLTDASGQEMVEWFGGQKRTRVSVLTLATSHGWEHYGNLVTYMRLKGIVPPSSERAPSAGQ